jgi:hypothetical protein
MKLSHAIRSSVERQTAAIAMMHVASVSGAIVMAFLHEPAAVLVAALATCPLTRGISGKQQKGKI